MNGPRVVPLASRLESHDGHEIWYLSQLAARVIVVTHPVSDSGLPQPRTRPVPQEVGK